MKNKYKDPHYDKDNSASPCSIFLSTPPTKRISNTARYPYSLTVVVVSSEAKCTVKVPALSALSAVLPVVFDITVNSDICRYDACHTYVSPIHNMRKTQDGQRWKPNRPNYQHKVLPERDLQLKLRSTNNGEILHSGGTLSGRQSNKLGDKYNEYPSYGFKEHIPPTRKYFPKERDPQHKSRAQGVQHKLNQNASSQKVLQGQMKMYVSEPDLRYPSSLNQEFKEKRSKKKYKAPPPPQNISLDDSPPLDWTRSNGTSDFPLRKARLFKTRAETKKQSSHPLEISENLNASPKGRVGNPNRLSLPEIKPAESDHFFKELKDATKRLRHIEVDNKITVKYDPSSITNKEKLKTLDHRVINTQDVKDKLMEKIEEDNKNQIANCARGEASGKESTTPENSPNLNSKEFSSRDKPRTFYFGMNDDSKDNLYTNEMFDNFTSSLHQKTKIPHSSESDISSYMDSDEHDVSKSGINFQLRPILPKKQLEIPRFSPAAAWRLLSMDTNENTAATIASDDVPVLVEERIEKYARPPPPFVHAGQRSSNDKSGDSGISGDDAIPIAGYEDNVDSGINQESHIPAGLKMLAYLNNHERISWTPQQDLGDDSSIEECMDDKMVQQKSRVHKGPHLFSLSLPRDNQLASYMIEKSNAHYSGLQKLKKSLSGVLNLSSKKDFVEAQLPNETSSNWFFNKSAPNSLNNAFHSLEMRRSQESELIYTQNVNKTTRLMYLPEIEMNRNNFKSDRDFIKNGDYPPSLGYSKSCEDIAYEVRREPEPLQDPATSDDFSWKMNRKPKKFTFQSTIRQIEKKRLSDKLSREAERREQKRIQELEAMQKVEEEFQKKRAREKANIRQQLRLYCLDEDPAWSSLPPNLEMKNEIRQEPDGAFSSSTSSSPLPIAKPPERRSSKNVRVQSPELIVENKMRAPSTRELSEYRQVQRDYKEFRGSPKYLNEGRHRRQTTVHPQVTCNMPKVKGIKPKENSNYRKDFAAGVRSSQSVGSTHSEESHINPRIYITNMLQHPCPTLIKTLFTANC
ncbi:hypothetical protein JTB14_023266 [Gonioctena quinquepunctata]|nr:hypothetical protein JTB14_023266 [Gonioctena quinquepunctata]